MSKPTTTAKPKQLTGSEKNFLRSAGWPDIAEMSYDEARRNFAQEVIDFPCVDQFLARGMEIFGLVRMTMPELKAVAK